MVLKLLSGYWDRRRSRGDYGAARPYPGEEACTFSGLLRPNCFITLSFVEGEQPAKNYVHGQLLKLAWNKTFILPASTSLEHPSPEFISVYLGLELQLQLALLA